MRRQAEPNILASNSVANILEVEKLDVRYAMPLADSTKLYDIMERVDPSTGAAVRPYTMTNKKGESVTATLVIVPSSGTARVSPPRSRTGTWRF